jgi:hypothetical protein
MMDWTAYRRFREPFVGAIDTRFFAIDQLDALLFSGRARLWSNEQAAIAAQLERYPSGALVLDGLIAAGELDAIKPLIATAEQWGRAHGATLAKIESRPGWVRALRNDGYAPFQTTIVKEL